MMTSLWFGLALLAVTSAVFLLWPLWFRVRLTQRLEGQHHARQLANIQAYKQKLAQLDAEFNAERMDHQTYQMAKVELEDLLLEETTEEVQLSPWAVPSRWFQLTSTGLILSIVLLGTGALYQQLGAASGLQTYFAQRALIEEGQRDFGSLLRRLEEAVQNNPEDAEGWSLLARIYLDLGLLEEGAAAIGELLRIRGPHARLLAQQAQALYFADASQLTERVQALIDQSLALDPSEPATLSLLGMDAYQREEWEAARRYWEAAIARVQDVQAEDALREGINDVRARLGLPNLVDVGPSFTLHLGLSDAAQLLTAPQATVFVYAVSEQGGAPVAAMRLRVADLPILVRLSDEQAMSPTHNLSSTSRVKLFARVAMSGTLEAQEGDWQGESAWLDVGGAQQVELLINRQL